MVLPPKFEKMTAGNAFSKHFRRFLVTLKEWLIPRKRRAMGLGALLKKF